MLNYPHLTHGLAYEWRRIRQQCIRLLFLKMVSRIISLGLWFTLLPLILVFHLVGYRRVTVFTERIGHLALEPDCLLKEQTLGGIPKHRWFILAPPNRVANRHLLNYWKPLIRVYEGRLACFILASMSRWVLMRHDISRYILAAHKAQAAYRIYAQWGDRPPVLVLTPKDQEWGQHALRELGIPKGAWFVCVHVRESGFSPIDEELHAHRNGTIETTIPSMQEITRRGGWVVRIGDPSMKPLPVLPSVIDYAHHPMKCERLDIILCAKSRFILGNTSGITLVGTVFGVPCALANVIPVSTLWFNSSDISIPKLLWSERLGRYLRFDEIMDTRVSEYRYATLYLKAGIRVDENSAEDIRSLVTEMIDRLEGSFDENHSDVELLLRFCLLTRKKNNASDSTARVAATFLRKYSSLLRTPD
ncbi:MAG: TIGR04372 family glycosyltransferase [Gammaproteobacteria bacterium]|nr:TIGR04372 family glycosyltransferase [Gammaproteobacteria bacterium]